MAARWRGALPAAPRPSFAPHLATTARRRWTAISSSAAPSCPSCAPWRARWRSPASVVRAAFGLRFHHQPRSGVTATGPVALTDEDDEIETWMIGQGPAWSGRYAGESAKRLAIRNLPAGRRWSATATISGISVHMSPTGQTWDVSGVGSKGTNGMVRRSAPQSAGSVPPNAGRWLIASKTLGSNPFSSTWRERGSDWPSRRSIARQESTQKRFSGARLSRGRPHAQSNPARWDAEKRFCRSITPTVDGPSYHTLGLP
jgi:hypothetical protein